MPLLLTRTRQVSIGPRTDHPLWEVYSRILDIYCQEREILGDVFSLFPAQPRLESEPLVYLSLSLSGEICRCYCQMNCQFLVLSILLRRSTSGIARSRLNGGLWHRTQIGHSIIPYIRKRGFLGYPGPSRWREKASMDILFELQHSWERASAVQWVYGTSMENQ